MSLFPSATPRHPATPSRPLAPSRRQTSGVFTRFDPAQIQTFKETFALLDAEHDGFLDEADIRAMLLSLGSDPARASLFFPLLPSSSSSGLTSGSAPVSAPSLDHLAPTEQGGQGGQGKRKINFTEFLSAMAEHLAAFDTELEMADAWESFDESDQGTVDVADVKHWLVQSGATPDEVFFPFIPVQPPSYLLDGLVVLVVVHEGGEVPLPRLAQAAQSGRDRAGCPLIAPEYTVCCYSSEGSSSSSA